MVVVIVVYKSKPYRVNLNTNGSALQFKELVAKATGIPAASQKIFGLTKGALKNETDLTKLNIREGQKLLLLSSAKAGRSTVQRVDVSQFNFPEGTESLAIYHLPDEIILYIFSFLTHVDLINCFQSCIYWNQLAKDNFVWENLFYDTWLLLEAPADIKDQYSVNWFSQYKARYKQDKKWLNAPVRRNFEDQVVNHFHNNQQRGRIQLVDMRDYSFPWCNNQVVPEILISMSGNTLQLINPATMRSEKVLRGHSAAINTFYARGKSVISADQDGNLLLWDMTKSLSLPWGAASGELVGGMLKVDATSFSSLEFDDRWLVAGANVNTIRVWDLERNALVHQFYETGPNPRVSLYDNYVRAGDNDGMITIFDLRAGKCVEAFKGHTNRVKKMKSGGDWRPYSFYSCGDDMKEWDSRAIDHGCVNTFHLSAPIETFDTDGSRMILATPTSLEFIEQNADRFMMEDKIINFARAVASKELIVSQIGAKPEPPREDDDAMREGADVENDMEVDELDPEYDELEAIKTFMTSNGIDAADPDDIYAARPEWRKQIAYSLGHQRVKEPAQSLVLTDKTVYCLGVHGSITALDFNDSKKKKVKGAYF